MIKFKDNISMNEFTSCFVGIPLPDKYLGEFSDLLRRVDKTYPNLKIVDPATPHVTAYYLDKQSQNNLEEIRQVVEENAKLLRGTNLMAGGMDTFGDSAPVVLFLPVSYQDPLVEFNRKLADGLARFMAENDNLSFHPHMTLAYFSKEETFDSWGSIKAKIEAEMNNINWEFPITEVVIYGVDSTKSPEHQEKLVTIPINE